MNPANEDGIDWEDYEVRADERVLLLTVPPSGLVAALSRRLERGIVVALGEREAVHSARRALREYRNVMFHPGTPTEIPFEDGFFTRIIDFSGGWHEPERVAGEIARALAPGGKAYLRVADSGALVEAGLVESGPGAEIRAFDKPVTGASGPSEGD